MRFVLAVLVFSARGSLLLVYLGFYLGCTFGNLASHLRPMFADHGLLLDEMQSSKAFFT